MSELLYSYYEKFGEFPPLYTTMTYDDPWYEKKMKSAIKTGKKITTDDFNEIEDADIVIEQTGNVGKSLPGFGAKK